MLGTNLEETRVYQDAQDEGAKRQAKTLILLQLEQKFGILPDEIVTQVSTLNLEQMGRLAIALLNFTSTNDLANWLNEQQS